MKQTLHTSRRAFKLALLCLMAFVTWGGNYCIAQETALLKFTKACGGKGTDNKGGAWTVTSDAKESQYEDARGIHYGTKKDEVSYINLSTSAYADAVITKIVVNASTASGVKAKVKCEVGGAAFGVEKELTTSNASYTFEGNASGNILVSVYKDSKATKALYIKSIEITYSTANLETTTLTLTAPDSPISIGGTYTSTPTLKAGEQTLSDKTITWSSDNDKVATVDAATGTVIGVAAGKANITAKFAGDDTYKNSKASYEIIVKGAPSLSFPETSYTIEMGDAFTAPKLEGLPEDVTPEYTSSNTEVATVKAATGEVKIVGVGTTTITVTSPNTGIYKEATASYELTVNRANSKVVTIDFSTFGYDPGQKVTEVSQNGIKLLLAKGSIYGAPAWYAPAVRMYKKSSLKITATSNIKKIEFVFDGTKTLKDVECTSGKYDEAKGLWIFTNVKSKEATITNGEQNQAYIKKIIVTTELPTSVGTITIATPEGFGTYYNSNSYILPEGLTAFGYKEANTDGTLVKTDEFTGGDVVPANAALVVKGNEGEYECFATDQAATKTLENNLLKGVAKATTVEKTEGFKRYVLTTVNNVLGFYRTKSGNIKMPANRAYLELTEAQAQAVSFFQLDGETTGIENATATTKEAPKAIYTLSGVRLKATTTQGLPAGAYVVNGKVVIVK
mgnify:CR=1 FL=1